LRELNTSKTIPLKKISLNELPQYTPWVERVLHLQPFLKSPRNLAKVDVEYDKNKYAKLLDFYNSKPGTTIADITAQECVGIPEKVCISKNDELFQTSVTDLNRLFDEFLIDTLTEHIRKAKVVVELGCGWGYNLNVLRKVFPNRLWLGGEYSQNAVKLGGHLFANEKDISISYFNWYDKEWKILENLPEKALIFTRHSIEQLPSVKSVIPTFRKYQNKIIEVVHLEPVYELTDPGTTLGLMRQAYTHMNDYNIDLLTTLRSLKVQILKTEAEVFGGNPLNPTSIIQWQFSEA
jgi:hypothetical protein